MPPGFSHKAWIRSRGRGHLSEGETSVTAGGAQFKGSVGSVQDRRNGLVMALSAKGKMRYTDDDLSAGTAGPVRVRGTEVVVEAPRGHDGVTVTVQAPGGLALDEDQTGVRITQIGTGRVSVTIHKGVHVVRLLKR